MKGKKEKEKAIYDALSEVCRKENVRIKKLPLGNNDRYAVFSDLHFGDKGPADNFAHNEEITKIAFEYYKKNNYSLILLGDIEDFWQFDDKPVLNKYEHMIYPLLRSFKKGSVHRVHGNHDREWGGLPDPLEEDDGKIFGYPEGILLDNFIFMVHGHQGDALSDKKAWLVRFATRLFRYVEPVARFFGYENSSAPQTQIPKDRECCYYNWAKEKKVILVCGHTHRTIFASHSYYQWLCREIERLHMELRRFQTDSKETKDKPGLDKIIAELKFYKKELSIERSKGREVNPLEPDGEPLPCYFNSGSGLYSTGITNLEIEPHAIRLIKWDASPSLPPEKKRVNLWGDGDLDAFKARVCG